jgi:Zn-dependent protease with chaperone function
MANFVHLCESKYDDTGDSYPKHILCNGAPLSLNLGSGINSSFEFTIPANGSKIFRSTIASSQIVTGWAVATATLPLQATVLFTNFVNGKAQFQASAPATLPTRQYWSPANNVLGVALANVYSGSAISVDITARDSNGNNVGTASVSVGPLSHTSFNLFQLLPGISSSFSGSIAMTSKVPTQNFIAWTLNSDSGALSSLPSGNTRWPISHVDRIWLIYWKVFNVARQLAMSQFGVDLTAQPATHLIISPDQVINALAFPNGTVQINLALSELISDSESELAFAVAHELGHIIQFKTGQDKTGKYVFNSNPEFDADEYGMFLSLGAGYDPYAAAGALAKLSMALNEAGLVSQLFDNYNGDLHGSFNNRIAAVYSTIKELCSLPQVSQSCALYKSIVHPHLPPTTPLSSKLPAE